MRVQRGERKTGLPVLRVDARDVRVDHANRDLALRTLGAEKIELPSEERLGLRARPERTTGEREAEGIDTGRVERGDAAGAAQELHDQLPVGGCRPAGAERDILRRSPLDVRHAPAVARDRETLARAFSAHSTLGAEPEGRSLEVAPKGGVRDAVANRCQALVEGHLVGRVPREGYASGLSGRENVPRLGGVVPRRRGGRDRGCSGSCDGDTQRDEQTEQARSFRGRWMRE